MIGTVAVMATASIAKAAITTETETGKVFFVPNFKYDPDMTFVEENTITIQYSHMKMFVTHTRTVNDKPYAGWDIKTLKVGTPEYEAALKEHHHDPIPPHIQFGGAVVSGIGDPNFRSNWEVRTIAHLANGVLA